MWCSLASPFVRSFVCRFRHRRCRFSHICVRLFKSSCDFCQSINLSPQKNAAAAAATDWAARGGRRNIFHDRTLTEPSRFALLSYIVLAYFDFMDMSMDQTVSECVVFFINFSFEHTIFWVKLSPRTALHGALGGKFFILSSPVPILSSSVFPAEFGAGEGSDVGSRPHCAPIFLCLGGRCA